MFGIVAGWLDLRRLLFLALLRTGCLSPWGRPGLKSDCRVAFISVGCYVALRSVIDPVSLSSLARFSLSLSLSLSLSVRLGGWATEDRAHFTHGGGRWKEKTNRCRRRRRCLLSLRRLLSALRPLPAGDCQGGRSNAWREREK